MCHPLDLISLTSFDPLISITDRGRRTHLYILVCQMNTTHYINLSSPGGLCVSAQQVKKRSQTWQRLKDLEGRTVGQTRHRRRQYIGCVEKHYTCQCEQLPGLVIKTKERSYKNKFIIFTNRNTGWVQAMASQLIHHFPPSMLQYENCRISKCELFNTVMLWNCDIFGDGYCYRKDLMLLQPWFRIRHFNSLATGWFTMRFWLSCSPEDEHWQHMTFGFD